MTMASLTASLLARKGDARPSASARDIFAPGTRASADKNAQKKPATALGTGRHKNSFAELPHSVSSTIQPLGRQNSPPQQKAPPQISDAARKTTRHGKRKVKTLRLDTTTDMTLRLLTARQNTTQQALMEKAVKALLQSETEKTGCICGSSEK